MMTQATIIKQSSNLSEKLQERSVQVGVIGLGYVGLPLAAEFAASGIKTLGLDTNATKVEKILDGQSYILDVPSDKLATLVKKQSLFATTDSSQLKEQDVIFICVPTPFTESKSPDLSYVEAASRQVRDHLREDQLIILQSTTYPGTTEEVLQSILEETGLKAGEHFYLAFSPERIDPGNKYYRTKNTPKVVGGINKKSTQLAVKVFQLITESDNIHALSSPKAAEMCKLLENIFRSVNIALVNELTELCRRMGINIFEVIDAASTKPFGYMPFYPGPGVGGHCIPVDPYYLSWKAREFNFYTNFIDLAAEVNQGMPLYTVNRIAELLNKLGKPLKGSRILIVGMTFKRNVDDVRNSPSLDVMKILLEREASIAYHDPLIPKILIPNTANSSSPQVYYSSELTPTFLESLDCTVVAVPHDCIDLEKILQYAPCIFDVVNAYKNNESSLISRVCRL